MFKKILKVRVQRIGDAYYPQYKRWVFWDYFISPIGYDSYTTIKFNNLEDATHYVCSEQEEYFYPSCRKDN